MIDIRLAQLRSYLAVADARHFGAGARAVGLGQSAVSQHVATLEAAVGAPLLTRTSRRVALTPAGERFAAIARGALRDLERAAEEACAVAAGRRGTLRVAAQQSARAVIVPATLAVLAREEPGLALDVLSTTTAEGLAALARGDVDAALVRDPGPREGVRSERLASDPVMVVLPAGHRLAARAAIDLAELDGEPRVGWARAGAPDYHDRIGVVLDAAGLPSAPAYELRGVDTRLGAVAQGLGWALESAAYRWMMDARVAFVPIEGTPLRGELVAVWPALGAAPGIPALLAAARVAAAAQPSAAASCAGSATGARQAKLSQT